jgi:hypothetical protein
VPLFPRRKSGDPVQFSVSPPAPPYGQPPGPRVQARPAGSPGADKMDTAARVLQLAQKTAQDTVAAAERQAQEIISQARQEAERIIADARSRAQGF